MYARLHLSLMTRLFLIRLAFNFVGTLAVVLGLIGIFLPLLPTTPFLLLATACYMRGSQRMANWLMSNRLFGQYIRDFHENRGIPRKTKIWALSIMWVSLGISAWVMPVDWARPLLLIPGIGVTIYLWRYKTRPPHDTTPHANKPSV